MSIFGEFNTVEEVMFMLTGINGQVVYVKTKDFNDPKNLIVSAANKGMLLNRVNSGESKITVAYAPGYFISAQIIDEKIVSSNFNKIWEII